MQNISKLKQRLIKHDIERRKIHTQLIKPRKLISGSLYKMYKKCGNKKCRCNSGGEKHGPFLCLSVMKKRKRGIIFIRKKDNFKISEMSWRYKKFGEGIKEIELINKETIEILKEIRELYEEVYK